ncbi:hypothetical protein BGZ51_005691 [Haplosporangium sp. Z 767]|nr:hypothetical protein BGZ51_005691 [Haplosporangium sp. Z 767]
MAPNALSTPAQQPVLSSSASAASSTIASTRKTRPGSAVLPNAGRPRTVYQAVTWKENLDAFNRRLRRGSLSLDVAAQEEEQDAAQTIAQNVAQHEQQQGAYPDQAVVQEDEYSQLLDKPLMSGELNNEHTGKRTYGTAPDSRSNQQQDKALDEPVFPTLLNPALATTKPSKLGVFAGVFVPCVLSIWGIILFLRFGFIIGQAGVVGTMGMFIVGYAINVFTTLSLSAISTNGTVRGGGVYYLVSRSLGPEFGGSIGLIYFFGTVIGCGMNVLGFVEPLIANFGETSGTVFRVLPEGPLFSRASLVLAVIILLSTMSIFVSFAVMAPFTYPERNIEYTGFSWETLQENMWPRFTTINGPDGEMQSFHTVFGVLFPACTGILAGASMSGDLEDPSKSIPKGTLWAVGSTFCVYSCIVVLMGGSISRATMYTDLSVLQDVSIHPLFIASGGLAASIFATLGCVIGAAKILQAIARDNLLPLLSIFSQGTPRTDEPTLAVLLTYILCQFCLFLTDMNAIATFVSMITLLTFLILNLACFLLKIGSAPNFRPSFRFFHWWTAFGGMVLCALVMSFVDLGKSLLSGLLTSVLFIWIHYWSPPKRWGDVTQSLIYHQVRKYLLRLDSRKEHVKFWRPQILLLVHHPRSEYHLIQFCNHLKKGALYVLGHVILGDLHDVLAEYRRQQSSWLKFVDVLHIKAFVNLSVADNVRIGARNLLIGTGLGGMRPNIVVLGSFNLQRYLSGNQQQQEHQEPHQMRAHPPMLLQKNCFPPQDHSLMRHTLLNIPASLPIDNIRVEEPVKITDYVSIIEDVLSLNKAVAIGYEFERLELPDEHKQSWKLFDHFSGLSLSSFFSSLSRPSSPHKHGENRKKKYIDLWPMQMSATPMQPIEGQSHPLSTQKRSSKDMSYNATMTPQVPSAAGGNPSRMAEANVTNFDTYTMVLQMGCILHMVPHWKENYLLRVMVFVEYQQDVEEEKKRLTALLDNLRIPAEVKVLCLDYGDSKTYDQLVKGQYFDDMISQECTLAGFRSDDVSDDQDEETEMEYGDTIAPAVQRTRPKNISPHWQQYASVEEVNESENVTAGVYADDQDSLLETAPYSSISGQNFREFKNSSSSSPVKQPSHHTDLRPSVPLPHRRRTISHPHHPRYQQQQQQQQQRPRQKSTAALHINTALTPRLQQTSPMAVSAYPSSQHNAPGSSGQLRYRSTMTNPTSPLIETRLGTSAPLGASMNFRIAVPLPKQFFDPNGVNSESDSDSIDSESDEDYDHELTYSGGLSRPALPQHQLQHYHQHPQSQFQSQSHHLQPSQQAPSAFAHTSLGSESGLGITLAGASAESEPDTHDQECPHSQYHPFPSSSSSSSPSTQQQIPLYQEQPSQLPSSLGGNMTNPWASSTASSSWSTFPSNSNNNNRAATNLGPNEHSWNHDSAYPQHIQSTAPKDEPIADEATFSRASGTAPVNMEVPHLPPSPAPGPIQFDNLAPEAQLMVLNELMRIHSSSDTTSILFTTVPAPEKGTCLREESSLAYLEQLDLLMEGIDIPALLIHAKSLTVTMTL